MGFPTWTTRSVGNGPLLPTTTRHFKFKIFAPIKYVSSDHIRSWSVCTLCSFSHSFTSSCQICDRTNIGWVAIENPQISNKITCYITAIQQLLVRSQIWKCEVEERLKLHNLRTDHVMICRDLRYWFEVEVAGTVKWTRSLGTTQPKNPGFMSGPGNNPTKTKRFSFLAGSGTEPNCVDSPNPHRWWVTWTNC